MKLRTGVVVVVTLAVPTEAYLEGWQRNPATLVQPSPEHTHREPEVRGMTALVSASASGGANVVSRAYSLAIESLVSANQARPFP